MKLAIYRPDSGPRGSVVELDATPATTPPERVLGFSWRSSIGPNDAIFFAFPADTTTPFTMRDTLFPLDILFVCQHGRIIQAVTAPARWPQPITAPRPYRYVLEVPGGWLARNGVGVNATLGWSPRDLGWVV
jgi:uncharacterized protein